MSGHGNGVLERTTTEAQHDMRRLLREVGAHQAIGIEAHDREGERVERVTVLGAHGRRVQVDIWPDGAVAWRTARSKEEQ